MYNELCTWYNLIKKTYQEDIMNNLQTGQFIKQLRKEQGMTQRKLAEKLNISEKTVSKWETGNGLPDTGIMLPLSKVLGITVNELLAGQRLDSVNYADRAEENNKDVFVGQGKRQSQEPDCTHIICFGNNFFAGADSNMRRICPS